MLLNKCALLGVRSGSVRDPFRVRTRSVRGPFGVRLGSVQDPRGIRSGFVRDPFEGCAGSIRDPKAAAGKKNRNRAGVEWVAVAPPLPTADTVIYFQEPKFPGAKISEIPLQLLVR